MPVAVRATSDFFDQLTNDLLVLRVKAQQRFRPLSAEELNRRPGPSRWSAGQCLEHLNIVGGYYLPSIAARIKRAQDRGSKPAAAAKQGYLGKRFIDAMRTPASVKTYTSPQRYAPTGSPAKGDQRTEDTARNYGSAARQENRTGDDNSVDHGAPQRNAGRDGEADE